VIGRSDSNLVLVLGFARYDVVDPAAVLMTLDLDCITRPILTIRPRAAALFPGSCLECDHLILDAKSRPDSLDYFVGRSADFYHDPLGWLFQGDELAFQ
jgi:hypothetical protein